MNIDFSAHPGFSLYIILLAVSGVLMAGIGATEFSRLSTGWRIFNLIAGLAFFGYAFYLAFLFHGGTYIIFFKAFILPVAMVINAVRSAATRKKNQTFQPQGWAPAPPPGQPGQPPAAWPGTQPQGWAAPQPPGPAGPYQGPPQGPPQASWPEPR